MAFDLGVDFRASAGYVTDPAGFTYCTSDNYPTTRGGFTFGWVTPIGGNVRDRSTAVDPRLAGVAFQGNTASKALFRIDLPATGAVDIYCALGDMGGSNFVYLEVFDNTTSLGVLCPTSTPSVGSFYDATGAVYTAANWPANNTKATKTFTTTTAIFAITPGTNTGSNFVIASLRVAQSGGAPPVNLSAAPLTVVNPFAKPSITQIQQLTTAPLAIVNPFPGEHITISDGTVNLLSAPLTVLNKLSLGSLGSSNNALTTLKIEP